MKEYIDVLVIFIDNRTFTETLNKRYTLLNPMMKSRCLTGMRQICIIVWLQRHLIIKKTGTKKSRLLLTLVGDLILRYRDLTA
jgi:hypothetical protein